MPPDDLNTPLGQIKSKRLPNIPGTAPQWLAGVLGLSGLVVVGWAVFVKDPLGGEPVAVVATQQPATKQVARDSDKDGKEHARHDGPSIGAPEAAVAAPSPPPGSRTVTIINGSSGARQQVTIPGNAPAANALLDPKLLETTRHGSIPKIGPDGTRPSARYAHPRQVPPNKKDMPVIAIVVGGLGISASGTADAFAKLPASVTFALAPYGADLEKLAEHARADEHEVLLQVPMEPFDYPDNDPGPQTLLTTLSPDQNLDRLYWHLSRFQGYAGIANFMGARFVAADAAMQPIVREAAKRGLGYLDDGSAPRSVAASVAAGQSMPFARADISIDAVPTAAEIDRALAKLEDLAKERGTAVGIASALPISIERIGAWIKTLESHGIMLVPLTTAMLKSKSS